MARVAMRGAPHARKERADVIAAAIQRRHDLNGPTGTAFQETALVPALDAAVQAMHAVFQAKFALGCPANGVSNAVRPAIGPKLALTVVPREQSRVVMYAKTTARQELEGL